MGVNNSYWKHTRMKDNNVIPFKKTAKHDYQTLLNPKQAIKQMADNYLQAIKTTDNRVMPTQDKMNALYDMAEFVAVLCESMREHRKQVDEVVYGDDRVEDLLPVISFLDDMDSTLAYSQVGYIELAEHYAPTEVS